LTFDILNKETLSWNPDCSQLKQSDLHLCFPNVVNKQMVGAVNQ